MIWWHSAAACGGTGSARLDGMCAGGEQAPATTSTQVRKRGCSSAGAPDPGGSTSALMPMWIDRKDGAFLYRCRNSRSAHAREQPASSQLAAAANAPRHRQDGRRRVVLLPGQPIGTFQGGKIGYQQVLQRREALRSSIAATGGRAVGRPWRLPTIRQQHAWPPASHSTARHGTPCTAPTRLWQLVFSNHALKGVPASRVGHHRLAPANERAAAGRVPQHIRAFSGWRLRSAVQP